MKPLFPLLCGAALTLSACTTATEKARGWLASDAPALAAMGPRILTGEVRFFSDRDARIRLASSAEPSVSCFGPVRFTATAGGVVELNCSNGQAATVPFVAFGPLSGAGRGVIMGEARTAMAGSTPPGADSPSGQEFAITYGLGLDASASYLSVPTARLNPAPAEPPSAASGGASSEAR